MAEILITPIQKRFSDVDSFMHVNNIWQQSYFDMGKTEFYTKVLGVTGVFDRLRIITASTHTDYIGQVRLTDDIVVTTDGSRINRYRPRWRAYARDLIYGLHKTLKDCSTEQSFVVCGRGWKPLLGNAH